MNLIGRPPPLNQCIMVNLLLGKDSYRSDRARYVWSNVSGYDECYAHSIGKLINKIQERGDKVVDTFG